MLMYILYKYISQELFVDFRLVMFALQVECM